jgi:streptogramin lyase
VASALSSVSSFRGSESIAEGPDGRVWFTEQTNRIGAITPAGKVTEYTLPGRTFNPEGIALGPDHRMWFTEQGTGTTTSVGAITPAGKVTEYKLPGGLYGGLVAAGPDGRMWITSQTNGNDAIVTVTTGGRISWRFAGAYNSLGGIARGPDGRMWFTELYRNSIAVMTMAGMRTEFPDDPTECCNPALIAAGPDGRMWFTDDSNHVSAITTAGAISHYELPTAGSGGAITAGADGRLWLIELSSDAIAAITPSGGVSEYVLPSAGSTAHCRAPRLIGDRLAMATRTTAAAHCTISIGHEGGAGRGRTNRVRSQDPAPGTALPAGGTVMIYFPGRRRQRRPRHCRIATSASRRRKTNAEHRGPGDARRPDAHVVTTGREWLRESSRSSDGPAGTCS